MSRTLATIFAAPPVRPGAEQLVALDLIDVPANRLRPVDPSWAAALGEQYRAGAKLPPIQLRPGEGDRFWLVIGGHRLAGARLAGLAEIGADIRDLSEAEARLAEIDENLFRHELTIIDRALSLAERKRVFEELHPETKHGGSRKPLRKQDGFQVAKSATRFSEEVAERIGLSERSVQQAVALANALSPDAVALIRGTYLADHGSDLAALARLRPDQQLFAARQIAGGEAKTLKDSLTALGRGPAPVDEQERLFQAIASAWSRANAKTRKRVIAHLTTSNGGNGNGGAARQEPLESFE